jgi:hypothetical protein
MSFARRNKVWCWQMLSCREHVAPWSLIHSMSNAYRWAAGAENPAHLFRRHIDCLQRRGDSSAGAWQCIIMHYAGKCCVAECSVGAGAATADLPRERYCIDARCAQKCRRTYSWGN